MRFDLGPTTAQVLAAFTDGVTACQGRVTDTANDGRRLLAQSVLPCLEEVRPGDRLQAGVAIRAIGGEVWVHPYLFRLVCSNGAIIARTLRTQHLADLGTLDPVDAVQAVREAVEACCEPDVFVETLDQVRTVQDATADLMVTQLPIMSLLSRLSVGGNEHLLAGIMDQFFREGDRSQFGLANAITATARELRDPDLRWELEELGGAIAVGALTPSPSQGPPATAQRNRAVLAGSV
jgi:hypothetical protein